MELAWIYGRETEHEGPGGQSVPAPEQSAALISELPARCPAAEEQLELICCHLHFVTLLNKSTGCSWPSPAGLFRVQSQQKCQFLPGVALLLLQPHLPCDPWSLVGKACLFVSF